MPLSEKVIENLQGTVASLQESKAKLDIEVRGLQSNLSAHLRNAANTTADYEHQIEEKTALMESIQVNIDSLNAKIQG